MNAKHVNQFDVLDGIEPGQIGLSDRQRPTQNRGCQVRCLKIFLSIITVILYSTYLIAWVFHMRLLAKDFELIPDIQRPLFNMAHRVEDIDVRLFPIMTLIGIIVMIAIIKEYTFLISLFIVFEFLFSVVLSFYVQDFLKGSIALIVVLIYTYYVIVLCMYRRRARHTLVV